MHATTVAFAAAALFSSLALAANTIAFTQVPANVTAGVPTVIKWAGGDPTGPVTITLKEGDPHALKSVAILTGDATGGSFTWTPSSSLPNAEDYALQITQDVNTINYSGLFPLSGGSDSSSVSTGTDTATATVLVANSTTATAAITTLPPSASGTGLSAPRNTTFVSQTLTPTGSVGVLAGSATSTGGSTKASATGSGASATPTGAAAGLGGSLVGVAVAGLVALAWM